MSSPSDDSTSRIAEILALEGMEGVGRVTTRKILDHFGGVAGVRRYPREQILNRLRRVPQAGRLVDRLLDETYMADALTEAGKVIDDLSRRKVQVVTPGDAVWPEALETLPNTHRPNALYAFGNVQLLTEPSVAIVGAAPVGQGPFEVAQALVRRVAGAGGIISCSASDGLDNVVTKITVAAGSLPILVAASGLGKVDPAQRSSVSAAVKAGALLVSSFPLQHGPFDHDVKERMLLQAALAKAVVLIEPREGSFAWATLEWSLKNARAVFALSDHALPDRVHVIRDEIDMDWVVAAVRHISA